MRALKLFIACSLDGYIADAQGGVDWLPTDQDYGITPFMQGVDATLMGAATYDQILTFGPWPYANKQNYVLARKQRRAAHESVEIVYQDPVAFTRQLLAQPGGTVWLVGGSQIILPLHNAGLISHYQLTTIPVILGQGVPLFAKGMQPLNLQLDSIKHYETGVIQQFYVPKTKG